MHITLKKRFTIINWNSLHVLKESEKGQCLYNNIFSLCVDYHDLTKDEFIKSSSKLR